MVPLAASPGLASQIQVPAPSCALRVGHTRSHSSTSSHSLSRSRSRSPSLSRSPSPSNRNSEWHRHMALQSLNRGCGRTQLSSAADTSRGKHVRPISGSMSHTLASAVEVERVPLGGSELRVPKLGIGTLQWGDPGSGFGEKYSEADLKEAYDLLTSAGLDFFDSAEVYGYQGIKTGLSSEQLLGKFEKEASSSKALIATKFFTIPWTNLLVGGGFRLGKQSLLDALKASLQRLGRKQVDLYQIHFPFPTFSNAALMEALAQAKDEGLAAAVGVSNYSREEMEEAHTLLAKRGIPLASNQVRYSLLARKPEKDGLLQACKDLSVSLVAYSPLASGGLSDRALAAAEASSQGRKTRPLLLALSDIGKEQGGKSISQVALAYLIHKGAIPIPACKNKAQAQGHLDTLGITLSDAQVALLEEKASAVGA